MHRLNLFRVNFSCGIYKAFSCFFPARHRLWRGYRHVPDRQLVDDRGDQRAAGHALGVGVPGRARRGGQGTQVGHSYPLFYE